MAWVTLCELSELTEGQGKPVDVDGYRLAVFLDAGQARVLENTCPHAGAPLAQGTVQDGCVVCPWHAWAFSLATGRLRGAEVVAVRRYDARELDHAGRRFLQADLPAP